MTRVAFFQEATPLRRFHTCPKPRTRRNTRPASLATLNQVGRVTRRLALIALIATGVAIWRERMLTANEARTAKLPTGN
jgi:hypothetical protein